LILCCKWLGLRKGFVLTFDHEEQLNREGIKIEIKPVWKWLLE